MTKRTNTKSRLLSSAVALTLLSATTLLQTAHASLSCASPSGSYQVGDSVRLELSGSSWWPRLQDVYSITANVYCWSGSGTVASLSISNGDSWTIPESALGQCSGDKMYVQFTGKMYDILHLAHIMPYWESCGALNVAPAPPKPTTTTKDPTVPPTQPPTQQPPATTTKDPTVPTGVPPTTTNPPTQQPPTTATTTSYSPIYTTTYTLVPTVISGTSTFISVTTVVVVTPTALPPVLTTSGLPSNGAIVPPDSSQLPGLPPSPGGNNNNTANKSGSNTNVPAAALGAVGGVAALALIVFGLVMTRKRRRLREEQEQAVSAGLGSKDDYYYDGASSFGPGTGGALAGAAGAAGAGAAYAGAGERDSSDDRSLPSLHLAPVHPPADGSSSYGWDFNTSFAAAGSSSAAAADGDSTLSAFPVPATTSDALKQQYDLANRFSIISQDSMLGFPLVPTTTPPLQAPASATAAYALNQQMSLKQELDNEDDAAFAATSPVVAGGGSPELYYLPVSTGSGSSPTTTPSQAFLSARGSPGITSASAVEGGGGARSSAYETVHSSSSAYATADSPSWSAASLQSHDIAILKPP
ncbi:MAG: hypothetical protein JOS17DRAFT_738869, partial [Linnemannia elongata]